MRKTLALIVVVVASAACVRSVPAPEGAEPAPTGPPEIQFDLVARHAQQFDFDVPDRPPGSQHELAAASYILGHLQLAGYAPRLDRVPVADTVTSTNVVAWPPAGHKPRFLVIVPYDTGEPGDQGGKEIGLFLELARAVNVARPDHAVGFVALGAESASQRGTRRLARFLLDEDVNPSIISLRYDATVPGGVLVVGSCRGEGTTEHGSGFADGGCNAPAPVTVLTEAGFEHTTAAGDIRAMGRELFSFLLDDES